MSEQAQDIVDALAELEKVTRGLNVSAELTHDQAAAITSEITRLRAELEEAREIIRKVQGTLVAVHYEIDPEKYGNADIPRAWALTTVALSDIRAFLTHQTQEQKTPSSIAWNRRAEPTGEPYEPTRDDVMERGVIVARATKCSCGHEFTAHTSHGCVKCGCEEQALPFWAYLPLSTVHDALHQTQEQERALYYRRCGWCGAYEGTVDPDEPCRDATDPATGEIMGPHQFGVYEPARSRAVRTVKLAAPPQPTEEDDG